LKNNQSIGILSGEEGGSSGK